MKISIQSAKRWIGLIVLIVSVPQAAGAAPADSVVRQTCLYAVKGTDSLYMDRYYIPGREGKSLCQIFMFGGGFRVGTRNDPFYVRYLEYFARKGYTMVSIDYRLGLREPVEKNRQSPVSFDRFVGTLFSAVDMAVEDLYDATAFVVGQAEAWGIDPTMIVTSGSSAGAITALQGEYELCNGMPLSRRLPGGFRYAGVIAGAGAVLAKGGAPQWKTQPAPVQMFHGDADGNVPYLTAEIGGTGLYGSGRLAEQFREMRIPYYLYTVHGAGHEMAGNPLDDNRAEIEIFLEKLVREKRPLEFDVRVEKLDGAQQDKKIGLKDFIRNNFGEVIVPDPSSEQ